MKKEIEVEYLGDYYTCKQFFDAETSTDGVDVYNEDDEDLGEIYGISIPDEDSEYEEIDNFNELVKQWLEQNNF